MPEIVRTYEVLAKGVGRRDHSKMVEYAVQTASTPALAQGEYIARARYTLPTLAFGWVYCAQLPLPSTAGADVYSYIASSISVSFFNFVASTNRHCLMYTWLDEMDVDFVPTESYFGGYGYSDVRCRVTKGIPTRENHRYLICFGVYSEYPTFTITLEMYGVAADLTRDWIIGIYTR